MGCDIHLFTERKRNINSKETWVNIDNWKINPYREEESEEKYELSSAYNGRCYALFAMLADVRNSDDNAFICNPKGIPDDCSLVVKKQSDAYGSDGHSHSWFTMKEIYDFYGAHKKVKYTGLVDTEGAIAIDKGEMPERWCKSSNVPSYVYREWEYDNIVMSNFIETLETHFKSEWYKREEDSEKFRIVFFFDN